MRPVGGLTREQIARIVNNDFQAIRAFEQVFDQNIWYGHFSKLGDQVATAINTPNAVTFTDTDASDGVRISTVAASRLEILNPGLYQIGFNIQVQSGSASKKTIYVWLRKNGVDVADSASRQTDNINGGFVQVAGTHFLTLAANDYIEIMFAVDDTALTIHHDPATAFCPATSAADVSITHVVQ